MRKLPALIVGCVALIAAGCGAAKEQLKTTEAELLRVKTQLDIANGDLAAAKTQLAAANAKLAELTPWAMKARALPVRISTAAASGGTNVGYQLVNLSTTPLAIRIHLNNTNSQRSMTLTRVLPAARLAAGTEIGSAEGWMIAEGDALEMTSEGFDVLTKRF